MQEKVEKILEENKNIIKTTNKENLNLVIADAISVSIDKAKAFKVKFANKEIYDEFVNYINEKHGFKVDISSINKKITETAEERCVYVLRQTERENSGGEKKSLSDIADELGFSARQLQKDVKEMTEQGFKLLGLNIKLVDERKDILKMESTPHPVILMQNITQLVVLLEGLRSMEKVGAYRNSANSTAVDIWNQLTEYARYKILGAVEKIDKTGTAAKWYDSIKKNGEWHSSFISERDNLGSNAESQLMFLMKTGETGSITYVTDDEKQVTLQDCVIKNYFIDEGRVIVEAQGTEYEIQDDRVLEAESIFHP